MPGAQVAFARLERAAGRQPAAQVKLSPVFFCVGSGNGQPHSRAGVAPDERDEQGMGMALKMM